MLQVSGFYVSVVAMHLMGLDQVIWFLDHTAILPLRTSSNLRPFITRSLRSVLVAMATGRIEEHVSMAGADFRTAVQVAQQTLLTDTADLVSSHSYQPQVSMLLVGGWQAPQ